MIKRIEDYGLPDFKMRLPSLTDRIERLEIEMMKMRLTNQLLKERMDQLQYGKEDA